MNMHANVQQCQADIVLTFWSKQESQGDYHSMLINVQFLDLNQKVAAYFQQGDLLTTVDTSLKLHANIKRNSCVAGGIATNLLRSTLLRSQDFMLDIFISQISPKMEYASFLLHTDCIGDIRVLESVQRRWTRMIDGLREMFNMNRLKNLDLDRGET